MKQNSRARVVRAEAAEAGVAGPAVALNLNDFAAEAREIVARARQEAEAMITSAHDQAAAAAQQSTDQAYAEGFAQGRSDGYAEGLRQAREEAMAKIGAESAGLIAFAEQMTRRVSSAAEELAGHGHRRLLEFAVEVAEKIVARVAPVDISAAQANLQKALELAGCNSSVTVRVSPGQLSALERYCGELCSALGRSGQIRLVGDAKISPGGVLVSTAAGTIDATIETQLTKVVDALLGGSPACRQLSGDEHESQSRKDEAPENNDSV